MLVLLRDTGQFLRSDRVTRISSSPLKRPGVFGLLVVVLVLEFLVRSSADFADRLMHFVPQVCLRPVPKGLPWSAASLLSRHSEAGADARPW